jgi:hypothetical protein
MCAGARSRMRWTRCLSSASSGMSRTGTCGRPAGVPEYRSGPPDTCAHGGVRWCLFAADDHAAGSRIFGQPVRLYLFRAGRAHARVWLVFPLVGLLYVDQADLLKHAKAARSLRVLLPDRFSCRLGFFLSIVPPPAERGACSLAHCRLRSHRHARNRSAGIWLANVNARIRAACPRRAALLHEQSRRPSANPRSLRCVTPPCRGSAGCE